jgi:DnaK suppressor protein
MAAKKKSSLKTAKVKKPMAAKPAAKKAVPVKKPPAKPIEAVKRSTTAKPAASPTKVGSKLDKKASPRPHPVSTAPSAPRSVSVMIEAADDIESGESLLAGPRNVQPYVARRGEQYMSKEQLEHFRTILQSWKQDLMLEVDRTVSHMKDEAANFPDPNDRATQEEEFSLELRTRDRERKLIRKIDEALSRIDDGSYGYCLETGEHIGVKRLEARPVATLSIEAQERRERREKQYGDRDDRYR